jgi:hypothetical protein
VRPGLLAAIHENVRSITRALAKTQGEQLDRIVILGDTFETGASLTKTECPLAAAGAVTVWGNHERRWVRSLDVRRRFLPGRWREECWSRLSPLGKDSDAGAGYVRLELTTLDEPFETLGDHALFSVEDIKDRAEPAAPLLKFVPKIQDAERADHDRQDLDVFVHARVLVSR